MYCFISQSIVLLLLLVEIDQNVVDGVNKNDDVSLFPHIFKFLYKNEQLCGDVFAEPQWLPAQSDCQIYCPMAKGLCLIYVNLSANGARIHKQKCRHFPVNCANELQRFLVTVFTNTTPSATTDIAIINATVTYNNTIKYHKGLNKTWNEMHERIRPDHGDNGITDATFQPAPGMSSRQIFEELQQMDKATFD
ncbi:Granzyme [Dirofilaria immitis]